VVAGGLEPNDPVQPLAEQAAAWAEDTLLVGHLPFLARIVARLLVGNAEAELVAFRPGSAVCLERGGQGRWQLVWMLRPELMPRQ
jgi:phosphohistidine phosphatase